MNVLVVAAHPDDEVLGCGGTIARHVMAGHRVDILLVADGETSRGGGSTGRVFSRRGSAEAAARVLGCRPPIFLDLPDNRLDAVPLLDIVQRIEGAMAGFAPEIIYTHHVGDLNIDHEIVGRAVLTAFRPLPGSSVRAVYGFEVLSSTGWKGNADPFVPAHFVDITPVLDRKMAALECYADEMRDFPHARSREAATALAKMRGTSQGLGAAEAFVIHRTLGSF